MRPLPLFIITSLLSLPSLSAAQTAGDSGAGTRVASADSNLAAGKLLFESQCARCHGAGGTGGIGPSFTHAHLRHAPTDSALVQVILGGIPGTAMAGLWNLSEPEAWQLTSYIRSLGRLPPENIPGDAAHGRQLYQGAGRCGSCHIIRGQGAGWAPDLTEVGLRLGAALLRQSLTEPGALQPVSPLPSAHGPYPAYLMIEVTTRSGAVIRGSRVSEDDFTLVLRGVDGHLHSLDKQALRRVHKLPGESPMPSYAATLSPSELDDVVAFLASQRGDQDPPSGTETTP
ncbi:MAG: c-type cytochrome [Gemmatimonadota bacterium]